MATDDGKLTPEQRQRLEALEATIRVEKVGVGFSIEDRDEEGRKKWALNTLTVGPGNPEGWTPQEASIVSCVLSKQVVLATYRDAARRRVMPSAEAAEEASIVTSGYDQNLANLLKNGQ